jgi:osmotically inducible protein OsmC
MKPFTRKASVVWLGSHQHGKGTLTTESTMLKKAPYLLTSHVGSGRGTSAPELIAAAHAGSFSITLADELGDAGYSPDQIDTTATVTMEDVAAEWTMTQIHLDVVASVPRVAQCDFIDATLRAKSSCPISRLLNANISMKAKLERRSGRRPGLASMERTKKNGRIKRKSRGP